MEQDKLLMQIIDLEREIEILPEGSITKKTIKGKEYYYHRVSKNGKRSENYVSFEDAPELASQIKKRKALEKELKELKNLVVPKESPQSEDEK